MARQSWLLAIFLAGCFLQACVFVVDEKAPQTGLLTSVDTLRAKAEVADSVRVKVIDSIGKTDSIVPADSALPKGDIDTKNIQPRQVVDYAKTLIGVPYKYGSTDPAQGFDCSGFVTHVFSRFNIVVPRSSIDFTHVGKEITTLVAKPGDLVLFTGTDSAERFVGHMGIVVDNSDSLRFIHSTSGKANGVTITPLNGYYKSRYEKTIRIFSQNE